MEDIPLTRTLPFREERRVTREFGNINIFTHDVYELFKLRIKYRNHLDVLNRLRPLDQVIKSRIGEVSTNQLNKMVKMIEKTRFDNKQDNNMLSFLIRELDSR